MKSTQPFELINTVINQSGLPASGFSRLWFRADYLVHQTIGGVIRDVTLDRPLSPLNIAAVANPIVQGDTVLEAFQKIQGSLNNIEIVGDVVGAGVYNNDKIEITVSGFGPGAGVDLQDTLDNDPIALCDYDVQITRDGATHDTVWSLTDDRARTRQTDGTNVAEVSVFNSTEASIRAVGTNTAIVGAQINSASMSYIIGVNSRSISVNNNSITVLDSVSSKGIVYASSLYDGTADDAWVPHYAAVKNYTDSEVSTAIAAHDLQAVLDNGSNATVATGVDINSENEIQLRGGINTTSGLGELFIDDSNANLKLTIANQKKSLEIQSSAIVLHDEINTKGIVYASAYDGTADDLWIPHYGAVKAYADSAVSTAYVATGIIEGGLGWTDNGDGTITIPTVDVVLNTQADFGGSFNKYTVTGGTTGVGLTALVDNDTNYIYIDYNSGTPQWVVTTVQPNYAEGDIAKYAEIYRAGNFLHIVDWDSEGSGLSNKLLQRKVETRKFEKASGLGISLGGNDPLQVNIAAGIVWNGIKRTTTTNLNSWDDIFFSNYHSGGSWDVTISGPGSGTLNNTSYDNGTDLVPLNSNRYVVNWIYKGVEAAGHIYQVIGTAQHNSISKAQEETPPPLPELVSSHAILIGRVICREGSTVGIVEQAIDIAFVSAAAANLHNELTSIQGGLANEYYHLSQAQHAIATQEATSSLDGYLTSADWTTFNNKTDKASGLLDTWTLDAGSVYYQDFTHNLNTEDIIVEIYDATTKETVLPEAIDRTDVNTVRIKVIGNSTDYRITVVG
jgi:hypothetical protein